ncbi:MAG: hypothetical protein MR210_01045 [Erysipelotrichaceae bacterium]|nr:hypothetical protein [Erysipelotrichaceae bacterium]MDY5252289.1 hypothetical protein [Erysipelotrichaceae bacterium]
MSEQEKKTSAVDDIDQTVEELKAKIDQISQETPLDIENKDIELDVAKEADKNYKENASKVVNAAIDQIKDKSQKIKDDEELKKVIDNIKKITEESIENLKKQYHDFVNDPKVQNSYQEVKEQAFTLYEKMQDYASVQIQKLKDNEEFMQKVNELNQTIDKGVNYANEKINEFTSRPEVNEKIEKAKDVAIDLAEKSTAALKNWLRPENNEK